MATHEPAGPSAASARRARGAHRNRLHAAYSLRFVPQTYTTPPAHHVTMPTAPWLPAPALGLANWVASASSGTSSPASRRAAQPSTARYTPGSHVVRTGFRNPWRSWHQPSPLQVWSGLQWGAGGATATGSGRVEDPLMLEEPAMPSEWMDSPMSSARPSLDQPLEDGDASPSLTPPFSDTQVATQPIAQWPAVLGRDETRTTWIGHASVLLELPVPSRQGDGVLRLLFDPIFSERCSPTQRFGPRRALEVPISVEDLPPIDLVFISHSHYDHLDFDSVAALLAANGPATKFFVPLGNKAWFISSLSDLGLQEENVLECDWWDEALLSFSSNSEKEPDTTVNVTCTPAQHGSGRSGIDADSTLWSSWYITYKRPPSQGVEGKRFRAYFAGDTGFQFHDPAVAKLEDKQEETESDSPPSSSRTVPRRPPRSQTVAPVVGSKKFSQLVDARLPKVIPRPSFTTLKEKPPWTLPKPGERFPFARVLQKEERSRTTSLKTDSSLSSDVEEPALLQPTPAYAVRKPRPPPPPPPPRSTKPSALSIPHPVSAAPSAGAFPSSPVQMESPSPEVPPPIPPRPREATLPPESAPRAPPRPQPAATVVFPTSSSSHEGHRRYRRRRQHIASEDKYPRCPVFEQISARLGPPDLNMLPISVGATLSFLKGFDPFPAGWSPFPCGLHEGLTAANHMTPKDAVRCFRLMDLAGQAHRLPDEAAPVALAIHWATFVGDPDEAARSLRRLRKACRDWHVRFARCHGTASSARSSPLLAPTLPEADPTFLAINPGENVVIPLRAYHRG